MNDLTSASHRFMALPSCRLLRLNVARASTRKDRPRDFVVHRPVFRMDEARRAEGSSSPALDTQQAAELEAKCASVLSNLEQRVREEERLQERCQSIMRALDTLMHDPDCGLAIVKQSVV